MSSGAWVAVPADLLARPETRGLTAAARLLWLAGRLHAGDHETDGHIEAAAIPLLMWFANVQGSDDLIAELVGCGLWQVVAGGWLDVTFLDCNPTHALREDRRRRDRAKKHQQRQRGAVSPGDVPRGVPRGIPLDTETETETETGQKPASSKPPARAAEPVRADVEEVCERMASSVVRRGGKRPTITGGWRQQARLLLDRDRRTLQEALDLIAWVEEDPFWRGNVLSLPALRDKFDRLRLHRERGSGNGRRAAADKPPAGKYSNAAATVVQLGAP